MAAGLTLSLTFAATIVVYELLATPDPKSVSEVHAELTRASGWVFG
jgi:hypothetical protein